MAETTYKSAYTGAQIDKAVGDVLGSNLPDLALQAKAAAQKAETAASEAEAAAGSIPTLPEITEADEGKVLGVVNGQYALMETYSGEVEVV